MWKYHLTSTGFMRKAESRRNGSGMSTGSISKGNLLMIACCTIWLRSRWKKLLNAWNSRREIFFKLNKIATIAKQRARELECDEYAFAPNHTFFNCARFANPLLAIDAGIRFGRE